MAGAIAYISRDTDGKHWKKVLEASFGPIDFRTIGEGLGKTDDIEIALAWKPDRGLLASLKNLKLIVSLGMGVDHLLADDRLPAGVPIVRIMDDGLIGQMSEYAIFWALRHHRDIDKYAASQRAKAWKPIDFVDTIHRRIGVMGLGTIGQDTAGKFAALGFPTAGWSRTAKTLPGRRVREVPGAHRHPGRRAAAHPRHTRAFGRQSLLCPAQGCLLHQHGARRPCGGRRPAGGARFGASERCGA
jgi:glyoxylate/hydroxypyruvate reductase A